MQEFDDYELMASSTITDLNDMVLKRIRQGYQPWQSPNLTMDDQGHKIYIQAVVKFKKERGI